VTNIATIVFLANEFIDVFSFDDRYSTAGVSKRPTDETTAC